MGLLQGAPHQSTLLKLAAEVLARSEASGLLPIMSASVTKSSETARNLDMAIRWTVAGSRPPRSPATAAAEEVLRGESGEGVVVSESGDAYNAY